MHGLCHSQGRDWSPSSAKPHLDLQDGPLLLITAKHVSVSSILACSQAYSPLCPAVCQQMWVYVRAQCSQTTDV